MPRRTSTSETVRFSKEEKEAKLIQIKAWTPPKEESVWTRKDSVYLWFLLVGPGLAVTAITTHSVLGGAVSFATWAVFLLRAILPHNKNFNSESP